MKKLISLALVAMLVFSLAACGGGDADGQNLSVSIGPDPETMDPTLNSASDAGSMIIHAFEGLLTYEQDGSFGMGQAEDYTVSDDQLTYTFTLREGLMWSNGDPLTANDFVYSWKRGVDPATAAPYAELFKYIEGYDAAIAGDVDALAVTAIDDLTLEVKLGAPTAFFNALVAFPTYMPLHQATIEEHGEAWATSPETYISNGAFSITEWVPGQHIVMSKNTNYRAADEIVLDTLTFALIADENAAYSAYQNGELLALKSIPINEIPSLADNPEYNLDPLLGTYYLNFNHNNEFLSDVNVRRAMYLAIDRNYLAEVPMSETYAPATNFVGPGFVDPAGGEFHEQTSFHDLDAHEANVEEAKQILADAGYPNGEGLPTFEYKTNPDGAHIPVAEALQQMWGEIGINIDIQTEEWGTFTASRRNDEFDIARNGWIADYADPTSILDLMITTNGNNDGGYSNPEFDSLMSAVTTETDAEERFQMMHDAEQMLVDDVAIIPLAYYADFYLFSEDMEGAWHNSKGYFFFHRASIK